MSGVANPKFHVVSTHFNLQPYHAARYRAFVHHCGDRYRLTSLLVRATPEYSLLDQTYSPQAGFEVERLPQEAGDTQSSQTIEDRLRKLKPDLILLLGGYSDAAMVTVIRWALRMRISLVLCSESKEDDHGRGKIQEALKMRVFSMFGAALVGGRPHAAYAVRLGMPSERVFLGYDAVDNDYFAQGSLGTARTPDQLRAAHHLPPLYFMASARFVEKKNLTMLLDAYAKYRRLVSESGDGHCPWSLVILGGGPMEDELQNRCRELRLNEWVHMPGFKQYPELPIYYGLASVFVHTSRREEWGLVVNEAMASGLPVLVSNRCGCASDLVQDGVNGFTFDPDDVEQLAQLMLKVSAFDFPISAFGNASRAIIAEWGPERFASGLKAAVDKAFEVGPKRAGLFERLILKALMMR